MKNWAFSVDQRPNLGELIRMPSKTAITEHVRKRKRTAAGKTRKRANRKKGTVNFYTAFETPAKDDKISKAS